MYDMFCTVHTYMNDEGRFITLYIASTVIINNIIIEDAAVNNYTCKFIIKLQGVAKVTGFVPYMQLCVCKLGQCTLNIKLIYLPKTCHTVILYVLLCTCTKIVLTTMKTCYICMSSTVSS